mmetsp:Transcript_9623/g.14656  ORF Transcript_9623/g.14656 Transcript_9623/m.14656 type:complete len:102 (+) Transcript_9623:399-704(+)
MKVQNEKEAEDLLEHKVVVLSFRTIPDRDKALLKLKDSLYRQDEYCHSIYVLKQVVEFVPEYELKKQVGSEVMSEESKQVDSVEERNQGNWTCSLSPEIRK